MAKVCRDMNRGETAARRWLEPFAAEQAGQANAGRPLTAVLQRIHPVEVESRQLRQDDAGVKEAGLEYRAVAVDRMAPTGHWLRPTFAAGE